MVIIKLRQGYTRVFDGKGGSTVGQEQSLSSASGNHGWDWYWKHKQGAATQYSVWKYGSKFSQDTVKRVKNGSIGGAGLRGCGEKGKASCLVICLPHYATQIKWKCCKMWFLFQIRALPSRRQYGNSFRKIRQAVFAGCCVIKIDNKKDSAQHKHNRLFKWHFWLRMK